MLATIRDDTWNEFNMQHIIPNSKRWAYSDIAGGGHKYIKGPAHNAFLGKLCMFLPINAIIAGEMTVLPLRYSVIVPLENPLLYWQVYCGPFH